MTRRCPDCDVPPEQVDHPTTEGYGVTHRLRITDPDAGGVLSTLGIGDKRNLDAYRRPECRLVRSYA